MKAGRISEKITPHTFRSTVGSQIAEMFDDEAAQKQLGHSSPDTTRKYYIQRPDVVPDYSSSFERMTSAAGPGGLPEGRVAAAPNEKVGSLFVLIGAGCATESGKRQLNQIRRRPAQNFPGARKPQPCTKDRPGSPRVAS